MKEVEKQAEQMIQQMFQMESRGKENLSELTRFIPDPEEYEVYEQTLDVHYMSCSSLTKYQFRKMFNLFMSTEKLFLELVANHYSYSDEQAKALCNDVSEASIFYLKIVTGMLDDEENARIFYKEIQSIKNINQVIREILKDLQEKEFSITPVEVSLAYASQDLFQTYLQCLKKQGLQTDFHSYTQFVADTKQILDKATEVLWKMRKIYQTG